MKDENTREEHQYQTTKSIKIYFVQKKKIIFENIKKQIMKKVKLHRKEILFIFVLLNILYLLKQKNKTKDQEKKTKSN